MTAADRFQQVQDRLRDVRTVSLFVGFVMLLLIGLMSWLIWLLSQNYCVIPAGIGDFTGKDGNVNVTDGCFEFLRMQLRAMSWLAYGLCFTVSLSVLAFATTVWAGARLSASASADGIEAEINENN